MDKYKLKKEDMEKNYFHFTLNKNLKSIHEKGLIANKGKNAKYIEKTNGGLSSARNIGIQHAKGNYIGFLDSDDYIEKDMYDILYSNINKYKADISICNFSMDINGKIKERRNDIKNKKTLDKKQAIESLIKNREISDHAWNKLYKKDLFDNIKFPEGMLMEDVAIMYLLFEKSNKIVYDDRVEYYYVIRKNSILAKADKKLIEQYEEITNTRRKYLLKKYPNFKKNLEIEKMIKTKIFIDEIIAGEYYEMLKEKKFNQYYIDYRKNYKELKVELLEAQNTSIGKIECIILRINLKVYILYHKLKRNIKRLKK